MRCSYTDRTARHCGPRGVSIAAAAARLRGQHAHQMVAPFGRQRQAVHDARGDVEIYRLASQRKGPPVQHGDGGEIGHHLPVRRHEAAGRGRVQSVDVSADGGKTWYPAQMQSVPEQICTVRFSFPWIWDGKPAVLQSRCTDETGYVQPTLKQLIAIRGSNGPFGSVYHLNAIQSWAVNETG